MITDEQGRERILKKLHDKGFKYLYFNEYLNELCVSDAPPKVTIEGKILTGSNCKLEDFASLEDIIEINKPYIDIEQELGIVDWNKVAVDTPIDVWDDDGNEWCPRYFARYEDDRVFAWSFGRTSRTAKGHNDVTVWDSARLAYIDKK